MQVATQWLLQPPLAELRGKMRCFRVFARPDCVFCGCHRTWVGLSDADQLIMSVQP